MKYFIVILMSVMMLAAMVSCVGDVDPYEVDLSLPEAETESTNIENSYAETALGTNIPTEQLSEDRVTSSEPPVPQNTSSPTQQNKSKVNNDQSSSTPYPSEMPNNSSVISQPAAPFDPSPYETEAIRYGKSLGLNYDEDFVSRGNWNPWVNLNDKLSEAQMMQNIRDSLQILVNEGREYFFVYCESQAENSYHMFIFFG